MYKIIATQVSEPHKVYREMEIERNDKITITVNKEVNELTITYKESNERLILELETDSRKFKNCTEVYIPEGYIVYIKTGQRIPLDPFQYIVHRSPPNPSEDRIILLVKKETSISSSTEFIGKFNGNTDLTAKLIQPDTKWHTDQPKEYIGLIILVGNDLPSSIMTELFKLKEEKLKKDQASSMYELKFTKIKVTYEEKEKKLNFLNSYKI